MSFIKKEDNNEKRTFTRQKTIVLNFDENTFFESSHYAKFVNQHPELKIDFDLMIVRFVSWAKLRGGHYDDRYNEYVTLPYDGRYDIDNNVSNLHSGHYKRFVSQMGTTKKKFSLTESNKELPNRKIRLIANVFSDIGVGVIVVEYSDYAKYYTYRYSLLKEIDGPIKDNIVDERYGVVMDHTHICLCLV